MTKRSIIPLAACETILKNIGAERVSAGATKGMNDLLMEYAETIGRKAIEIAKHTGRKTVNEGDIRLAKGG